MQPDETPGFLVLVRGRRRSDLHLPRGCQAPHCSGLLGFSLLGTEIKASLEMEGSKGSLCSPDLGYNFRLIVCLV